MLASLQGKGLTMHVQLPSGVENLTFGSSVHTLCVCAAKALAGLSV